LILFLAIHADGQYQANTFQTTMKEKLNVNDDPYFLLVWDAAHWVDRVMESIREKDSTTTFFKRLVKRSNRLYTMFSHGRGHVEYVGLAKQRGVKSFEISTFSTTRFFSFAY